MKREVCRRSKVEEKKMDQEKVGGKEERCMK